MLPITPAQLEVYRKSARNREAELRNQMNQRRQKAWETARIAAKILKETYGASRVMVFGSLIHPERYHLRSDIDLAVWDIHNYFHAVSRLMDIDPEFDFDLIPIEDTTPAILAIIQQEAVEI